MLDFVTNNVDADNSECCLTNRQAISESTPAFRYDLDLDMAAQVFRSGFLILDQRRFVLSRNRNADDILEERNVLKVANGYFVVEKAYIQRAVDEQLKRITASVAAGTFDAAQFPFIGVPDRNGAVRYALKVVTAVERGRGLEILMAIVDLADKTGPTRSTFSAVFGLSEREAELAELFSRGWRLEQISAQMNVALNTARVHLRNIFAKTNCSGQLELMRMLSRLSACLLFLGQLT
jgi:DNA-binding CsgD family transcriptional regulator